MTRDSGVVCEECSIRTRTHRYSLISANGSVEGRWRGYIASISSRSSLNITNTGRQNKVVLQRAQIFVFFPWSALLFNCAWAYDTLRKVTLIKHTKNLYSQAYGSKISRIGLIHQVKKLLIPINEFQNFYNAPYCGAKPPDLGPSLAAQKPYSSEVTQKTPESKHKVMGLINEWER